MLAPEEAADQPEVFASEEEVVRSEVLVPEDEVGWQKMLTLDEEAFVPDVLVDEASQPELFT